MGNTLGPTTGKQRFVILDALRGVALMMIILANFPEFGLWTFLDGDAQASMASAGIDRVVRFLQYFFIDGKGYTIFSLLFGCGFAIILEHSGQRGNGGIRLFYRRMSVLILIALCHLMFIWSGDILCLYSVCGLLLPLFTKLSDRGLILAAGILLSIPVVLDFGQEWLGIDMAAPLERVWWSTASSYGITADNFAIWLRDAGSYREVSAFLKQGAVERMWEFLSGHRIFKVLGFFVLGYAIGRNRIYARLEEHKSALVRMFAITAAIGIPASFLYAVDSSGGHTFGEGVHSLLYMVSVVPMAAFYLSGICLLFIRRPGSIVFRFFSTPGRMALTNYIGQSVIGVIIYYGIGFGFGLSQGLAGIELTALAVFAFQTAFSVVWTRWFKFGPLELVWRMLTYGKWLDPLKR